MHLLFTRYPSQGCANPEAGLDDLEAGVLALVRVGVESVGLAQGKKGAFWRL